jgi:hypothetical protein
MSSQDDYSDVIPADGDVARVCDKIYEALVGENVVHILSALEAHFIYCMSLFPLEERQSIARELKRGMPGMLVASSMEAERNDHACH